MNSENQGDVIRQEQTTLRHVEGTTLVHLNFAIKQDQVHTCIVLRFSLTNVFPLTGTGEGISASLQQRKLPPDLFHRRSSAVYGEDTEIRRLGS